MDYEKKEVQIRQDVVRMLYRAQSGHPGSSLSCVEIVEALYYNVLRNIDPDNPKRPDRDRFVMSKGHGCPTQYAILADLGFFPREDLEDFRQVGSHLQGHPDCNKTPGIDCNVGSLGQGASVSAGMALAAKHAGADYKVYCLIGDGESQEGIVWEAAMSAAHYKLDNLIFLLDHNGLQIDGANDKVMSLGDICAKFEAFGWETVTIDGHDIQAVTNACLAPSSGKPRMINCLTVKGKGVSFMENNFGWHGKVMSEADYSAAAKELGI